MPLKIHQITIGLYGKHLLFWLVVGLITTGSVNTGQYYARQKGQSQASLIEGSPSPGSVIKQVVTIAANGQVKVNGRPASPILSRLSNAVELRLKLLDQPGFGIANHLVELNLPEPVDESQVLVKKPLIIHSLTDSQSIIRRLNDRQYQIETFNLSPEVIYTAVIELPKNYLRLPFWQPLTEQFGSNFLIWLMIGLTVPLLAVTVMVVLLWRVFRSRYRPRSSRPSSRLPSRLPPAVVGLLYRGRITNREIAATIIDLAWRGFLELYSSAGEFSLVKRVKLTKARIGELRLIDSQNQPVDRLLPFERALTNKIFYPRQMVAHESDVLFRVGHRLFSQKIARVYIDIYDSAYQTGLLAANPAQLHRRLVTSGLVIFFTGLIGFGLSSLVFADPTLLFWVGMLAAGVVITQLASLVSPLSPTGQAELAKWLAFRAFLTDRAPIDYQLASQRIFERYLPYAIVLGAERQWLDRFANQPFAVPDWFSTAEATVTLETFAQRLFAMIATTSQLLVSSKDPSVQ